MYECTCRYKNLQLLFSLIYYLWHSHHFLYDTNIGHTCSVLYNQSTGSRTPLSWLLFEMVRVKTHLFVKRIEIPLVGRIKQTLSRPYDQYDWINN